MNETPAAIVKAAKARLSSRSWPLAIAATPRTTQQAIAAPMSATKG